MNWSKVIENLLTQAMFNAKRANEIQQTNVRSGASLVQMLEYRQSAEIASILAEALQAGLAPKHG